MAARKIKIKGHESFYLREGWLTKGIHAIQKNEYILSDINEAVDELGVGSNMAKSIRYWLRATGLTIEEVGDKSKRKQVITEDFGNIIVQNDKYFEDLGTLYLLHYQLVKNFELSTSWSIFFNKLQSNEFTKNQMFELIKNELIKMDPEIRVSDKSLLDDCQCIIKTYLNDKHDDLDPEDNLICPLSYLGLLKKSKYKSKEDIIQKAIPAKRNLNELILLYVILDNLNENTGVSIKNLIEDENNVGKVFNLSKNRINDYIDDLQDQGYITVTRTAGLNMIYPKKINSKDILLEYYKQI